MEMETSQMPESGIHQKLGPQVKQNYVENGVHLEKETNEMLGSEINEEPMETCQDTVVEIDSNPEKHADPEARLEVNQKPMETCQEIAVEADVNQEKQTTDTGIIYRCKRCRRMLSTQEFVVTHEVGQGEESLKIRKGFHVDEDAKKPECMCIFVEPMKWMQAVEEGCVSQKLYCMGCKALLGSLTSVHSEEEAKKPDMD